MNRIWKTQALLIIFLFISFLSTGISQEFLIPEKENDLDRETRFIEAQSELIIGNVEGAIEIYKGLLKKDVNDDEAAFFLGKTYLNNEDIANSIKYFSLALANEKNNPWYYIWAADAYIKNKQFDQAILTIENLVSRFPDEKSYYERLEYMYRDSKQYDKQIALIDRMIDRFGFHKNEALGKVQALENSQRPKEALELLADLSERFPQDLFILNMLANYYERYNQENLALEVYKKILAINPNDSRANLAMADAGSQEITSGEGKLMSMKSFFLNKNIDFDTQFSRILSYFQQDLNTLPEAEINALEQVSIWLLESHPDEPKALALRADILAQTGQNVEATKYYIQTIKVHPDNYMVWEQLLWSLKELHRWEDLNRYGEDATMYFPNKAAIYLLKGEAGYYLGDKDEALFDLETCISLSGNDPVMKSNAMGLIGLVKCTENNMKTGKTSFDLAREILDKNPNTDYFESICLLERNEVDQSLDQIEKALIKVPDKPSYRVQKAKVLYAMGNYQESLQTLLPLEGKTTYYPVYEWIALNYKQLKQLENAEKYTGMAQKYGAPEQKQIRN